MSNSTTHPSDDAKPRSVIENAIAVDSTIASFKEFDQRVDVIIDNLLNKTMFLIKGVGWRLVEVELYFHGGIHKDPFTHCAEMQSQLGKWYFHRKGNSYKSGTFKGLDISIGTPGQAHGGILIRSIECQADGKLVEGPCRVVDTILRLTGHQDIASFVDSNATLHVAECRDLRLHTQTIPVRDIQRGPRYGLVLRSAASAGYFMRPYRFTTAARQLTKQRVGFALYALSQGTLKSSPKFLLNIAEKEWQRCTEAFTKGKASGPEKVVGVPLATNALLAEAYGACNGLPLSSTDQKLHCSQSSGQKRAAGEVDGEVAPASAKKAKTKAK